MSAIDVQEILFGVSGQTLWFDAPEGRPSSVTSVQVFEDTQSDTGQAETATTGSPSVEAVSLTFNAASGVSQADPTKLNLASVAGLVRGRQYLVGNTYQDREWVELARIDTANTDAYARNGLLHDYASADTLVSTRMTVSVDPTWVSEENNVSPPLCPRPRYRVVWTYVVDGVTHRHAVFFDLVRYPFSHTVTAADVDRLSRGWLHRLSAEDRLSQGEAVIAEAVRQLKFDLHERDAAARAYRNQPALNELIRLKAVALVAEAAFEHGGISKSVLDYENERYWNRFEALVGEPKVQAQVTADGAGGIAPNAPIWRR